MCILGEWLHEKLKGKDSESTIRYSHSKEGLPMLSWAVTFFVIAIIAGVLGLSGVAGTATNIAYILFVVFLIVAIVSYATGRRPPVS